MKMNMIFLALNAASLGLQLAGVPLESPVGAVRMSLINDNWVATSYKFRTRRINI